MGSAFRAVIASGLTVAALSAASALGHYKGEREAQEDWYRVGRMVGYSKGGCDAFETAVAADPDGPLSQRPSVQRALASCKKLPKDLIP